ncbi:DUF4126 domain-containing protein [uncultured Desulfobacter sp.]|uniref:DUF4126 domain-containing protein n=1 Tax=uncultured Desulfobacter sp. TaxID=240139 RepID=UPI0029F58DAB|nr:DUF4126 domain-containing protein [uncultured Desulfobacter sp.]
MESFDQIIKAIALSMGAAWASGINLYATVFVLGILGATGNLVLPQNLEILSDPVVLWASGFMYCVEFFADKTPGVDTGWDAIHTFIRIPAGVMLAAGAVGDVNPSLALAAGILGGGLTAGSHLTKSGSRLLINTSPEPFSNWIASVLEDVAVIGGILVALHNPVLFLAFLTGFICLIVWLLPKIWRGIKMLFAKIKSFFNKEEPRQIP